MDVARDLVDRQLVDHEDERECGRVDDVWIEWSREGAHLGALASGAAIVLDQFGAAGRLIQRIGGTRARRSRIIEWANIARVERSRVLVDCDARHAIRPQPPSLTRRRYAEIARLTVIDVAGEERGVLDLRSETVSGGAAPPILGVIVCRRTWLRTLGMKRYDATGVPLADVQDHARFVPWNVVSALDDSIRLRVAFADLPLLRDAPDPGPPPRGEAPEKP